MLCLYFFPPLKVFVICCFVQPDVLVMHLLFKAVALKGLLIAFKRISVKQSVER